MTNNVLQFPNAIAGGTVSTNDVAARATEWIQKWFRRSHGERLDLELSELKVGLEERHRERGRVGFRLHSIQRVLDEGRIVLEGPRSSGGAPMTLEEALSNVWDELSPAGPSFRVAVTGRPKALRPVVEEQLVLIGREALINALRHSNPTKIEAEIEYLPSRLHMMVRDNGCGMDPQVMRSGRDAHWGLVGMRERARSIGANLRIWSRPGCGTEIEVWVPGNILVACA
jgi:signal transduction histidine kinase